MSDPSGRAAMVDGVYSGLPYGIVVVDREGEVVGSNPVALEILFGSKASEPVRCSDLFACDAPGGPCKEGCLALRALESESALPEVRVETRGGAGASAAWVTAARLDGGAAALLHLRPGQADDRRRRSDPDWRPTQALRIRALGRTAVDGPDGPIAGRWLGQRPGQLLKYLVCQRDRIVHVEEIAEALWPGSRRGLGNVRFTVHALRKRLEPDRKPGKPSSFVIAEADGYALDRHHVSIDADDFEAAVHTGVARFTQGDDEAAEQHLEAAVALYGGDLFADDRYVEWVQQDRERLRGMLGRALRLLARVGARRGDLDGALDHLERLAALEPFDADVIQELLTVLLRQGRHTRAARHYSAYRERLARDFGQAPGFTLADLGRLVTEPAPAPGAETG